MRTRFAFLFFGALILMLSCDTQSSFKAPDENYFLKYFGNQGSQFGVDFVVNPDGTFVLIGNSKATESSTQKLYVAKADAKGLIMWERTFGDDKNMEAKDIEFQPDGNLLILANIEKAVGDRDVFLLRLSQEGESIASVFQGLKKLNGQEADENAASISLTSKGIIVSGSTTVIAPPPPPPLLPIATDKTDAMHLLFRDDLSWVDDQSGEWKSRPTFNGFGKTGEEKAVKVFEADPNTFYVMAYTDIIPPLSTSTVENFNFWIYQLNGSGTFAGSELFIDEIGDQILSDCSIAPLESGGGFFLTGTSQNATSGDIYFVQLTQRLNFSTSSSIISRKSLNIPDFGKSSLQTTHNSASSSLAFYATSEKLSGANTDIYLTKRNIQGGLIFERVFGGIGNDLSGPVVELPGGGIVMIGTMTLGGSPTDQKKIVLMKLNSEGRLAP